MCNCGSCRYGWWFTRIGNLDEGTIATLENGGMGECRRRSPIVTHYSRASWPLVELKDWCGEYDGELAPLSELEGGE